MGNVTPIRAANAVTGDQFRKMQKQQKQQETLLALVGQLRALGMPSPQPEKLHLVEGRDWRADLFWQEAMLVVEYEGGVTSHLREVDLETGRLKQSRHLTPKGFRDDCEKYNAFTAAGYAVLRAEVQLVNEGTAAVQIAECYFARLAQFQYEEYLAFQRAISDMPAAKRLQALHKGIAFRGGDLA